MNISGYSTQNVILHNFWPEFCGERRRESFNVNFRLDNGTTLRFN